mgnify:FL=1|tara:strand:- start:85 stop:387 length:303 start_codon:yes stop_codon:yes gene_type:complete
MGRAIKDVEGYIQEAIKNIRDDRDITSTLLTKLFVEINKANDADSHKNLGFIAAKYVETLQRSNEQLVKLTSFLSKKSDASTALTENDKKDLFDVIQGEK